MREGLLTLQFVCALPSPRPLSPMAGGKAGPGVRKAGKLALSLTCCSTVELILNVGVEGKPPQGYECGRANCASCLLGSPFLRKQKWNYLQKGETEEDQIYVIGIQ